VIPFVPPHPDCRTKRDPKKTSASNVPALADDRVAAEIVPRIFESGDLGGRHFTAPAPV